MIHRCALALISLRGRQVVPPTLSPVDPAEADFLSRHIEKLRETVETSNTRGRFRQESILRHELPELLLDNDDEFLVIADKLVSRLADAMKETNNASGCVTALIAHGPDRGPDRVTFLKLDAEVEAAELERLADGGVRLHVYQELLPKPGQIQKGFSWPDPRSPKSDLIVLDKVVMGSATKYFQDAFEIEVSPKWQDTQAALVNEISKLPPSKVPDAIEVVAQGGPAEEVVRRIRERVGEFAPTSRELGIGGALGGSIRPGFASTAQQTFHADSIELRVPLTALPQVRTVRRGGLYVTTITTSTPLTPVVQDLSVAEDNLER